MSKQILCLSCNLSVDNWLLYCPSCGEELSKPDAPDDLPAILVASQELMTASTTHEVAKITLNTLKNAPYVLLHLQRDHDDLILFDVYDSESEDNISLVQATSQFSNLTFPIKDVEPFVPPGKPLLVQNLSDQSPIPEELRSDLTYLGFIAAAMIPLYSDHGLEEIFILATRENNKITPVTLIPYSLLTNIIHLIYQKANANQIIASQKKVLKSLNTIAEAVSVEIDLGKIYKTIHNVVSKNIGDVSFSIAIFDKSTEQIQIPYVYEGGKYFSVDPFPLGEGLTSKVIQSRRPLMIVENTEKKMKEMKAKIIGEPALSWLGVPLLIGGDVLGAIILQDMEVEGRFNDDDLRLVSILASQISVTINNIRLLEKIQQQAQHERKLYDITKKIHGAPDIQTIITTTKEEVSKVVGTQSSYIEFKLGNRINDDDRIDRL
jgi:transcriptional regulator with GAF, ATPase, and Fis domain